MGSIAVDRGIFSQCQCSTCSNQCSYLIVRASRLYGDFTTNDLTGSSTLSVGTSYHIAFVYNYQTQQQILYLNGIQDVIKSNALAYQGANETMQIGSTQIYSATNCFNGYIGNLKLITRAKSTTELLNNASLTAYYSFDLSNPVSDNSSNGLNETLSNTVLTVGRVTVFLQTNHFQSQCGTTGSASYTGSGYLVWWYIGYGGSCFAPTYFSNTGYQGSIDEIYIHNRELTNAEVTALANP